MNIQYFSVTGRKRPSKSSASNVAGSDHTPECRDDILSSDDDEMPRNSGTGILEFSPDKAGLDVTPANFDFHRAKGPEKKAQHPGTLSTIAGKYFVPISLCKIHII